MSIPVIDTIKALGNFPVANASDVDYNGVRVSDFLEETSHEISGKVSRAYVDNELSKKASAEDVTKVKKILGDSNPTYEMLMPVEGMYIDCSGGIGSVVDLTPKRPSTDGHSYVIADCNEGDEFLVSARGSTAPRAWCFIDSENKIIAVADEWAHVMELPLIAPAKSKKIIISDSYGTVSFRKTKSNSLEVLNTKSSEKPINIKQLGLVGEGNRINAKLFNKVLKTLKSIYIPVGRYYVDGAISTSGIIEGEYSAPAIDQGGIWDFKESQNSILDFSDIEGNDAVSVSWGGEIKNITIIRNDYTQSENRELARRGNNQPIYVITNKNENGTCVKLKSFSAKATNVQVIGAGGAGIWCEVYGYVNNCHAQMCRIGYRLQGNDNQVSNIRAQAVTIGLLSDPGAALNSVINVRVDSAATHGAVIRGIGSTFTNLILDGCYYSGLHIEGTNNIVNNIQTRCCLAYPRRLNLPLTRDTYNKTCAVSFEVGATGNVVDNIPSTRPNIMDTGSEMYNLDFTVGFSGGNINNTIKLYGRIVTDETVDAVSTLASVVSGNNAPNTVVEYNGKSYSSESFTGMDGDLIIDGVANYNVVKPHIGMIKVIEGNAFIYNGTKWINITGTEI